WLIRLFVWHGSVLQKIYSRLLLNVALSISVIFFLPWYETLGIKLTIAPFSILGVAIAIFLGFRNSVCYARFNEARTLWGQLAITQRSFLRETKSLLGDDEAQIKALVNLQVAFCHALRLALRKRPVEKSLQKYLTCDDLQWVLKSQAPCNRILLLMGDWLADKRKQGLISDVVWSSLNHHLNDLSAVAGGCERIANTPIPFAYTLILHRTVYLFCIMLPFALVTDLHYMTPFLSVFISYTFISLDTLAEELEEPFGTEDNDLPLDAICNSIERDLHDMDESEQLPEKLRPNRYYRLS
ncbi:MAG TPA: bestrophin family ion channel, partial [Buttiauxella sp.]|nr:bestrophin family ion channel [Buttiauxella sp.]